MCEHRAVLAVLDLINKFTRAHIRISIVSTVQIHECEIVGQVSTASSVQLVKAQVTTRTPVQYLFHLCSSNQLNQNKV